MFHTKWKYQYISKQKVVLDGLTALHPIVQYIYYELVMPLERYRHRYNIHFLYVVWDYRCPSSTTISIYIMASPSYKHPIFADETDFGSYAVWVGPQRNRLEQ
jgi:hypothetical protein